MEISVQAEKTLWTWPATYGNWDSFVLEVTLPDDSIEPYEFEKINVFVDGETLSHEGPNDLVPGETYYATVYAILNGVSGDYSSPPFLYFKKLDVPGDPAYANGIVSWTASIGNYDGYIVYISIDGVDTTEDVAKTETSVPVVVPYGGTYSIYIVSYLGAILSEPSTVISGTLKPAAPTGVSITFE